MNNKKNLLSNEKGDVIILVLIIAGVLAITLSTLTVYSVNQANYINRVRESYQMMSGTESLAKMVAHSRNLAKQRLLQIGIDDTTQTFAQVQAGIAAAAILDPLAQQCDTDGMGARLQAVGSVYYCLTGAANARPQVCIPRPDMPNEQICSTFDYSMNSSGGGTFDIRFEEIHKKSNLFKAGEMLAKAFKFGQGSARGTSQMLHKNRNSGIQMVAGLFKSKADDMNLFNTANAARSGSRIEPRFRDDPIKDFPVGRGPDVVIPRLPGDDAPVVGVPTRPVDPAPDVIPPTIPVDDAPVVGVPTRPVDPAPDVIPPTIPVDDAPVVGVPTRPVDPAPDVIPPTIPVDDAPVVGVPTRPTDPAPDVIPPVGDDGPVVGVPTPPSDPSPDVIPDPTTGTEDPVVALPPGGDSSGGAPDVVPSPGTGSSPFYNLTLPPPSLSADKSDTEKRREMAEYLRYVDSQITGHSSLISASSASQFMNYLSELLSSGLLSGMRTHDVNGLGYLKSYLGAYARLIDLGETSEALHKLNVIKTHKLGYAREIAASVPPADSSSEDAGTITGGAIQASANWDQAIGTGRTNGAAATVPQCTSLDRCVQVRALSGDAAGEDGKSFLQNVFVQ